MLLFFCAREALRTFRRLDGPEPLIKQPVLQQAACPAPGFQTCRWSRRLASSLLKRLTFIWRLRSASTPLKKIFQRERKKKLTTQLLRLWPQQPTLKNPLPQPVPLQTALQT
jgi:hypothetical protein